MRSTVRSGGPNGARLIPVHPAGKPSGQPRKYEAFRESGAGLRLSRLLQTLRGGGTRIKAPFAGNGYHYEAEALIAAQAAGQGEDARMPLDDSIALIDLMEEVQAKADTKTGARP